MSNEKLKRQTALLSVASNTLLVILKLVIGIYAGSISLISEALHSGIDLVASLIAFWAVKNADLPPDKEHAYGHGKIENISSGIEAFLIIAAAIGIIMEAIEHWQSYSTPQAIEFGIIIMIISITVNYIVSERLMKVATLTDSQALAADGLHLKADIWSSLAVLLGLFLIKLTNWVWLDPVIAIGLAAIIFKAGWGMVIDSFRELTDSTLPEEYSTALEKIFYSHKEVLGFHCLRTRKSGSYRLLDVHLLLDGNLSLYKVHHICDEIESQIRLELGTFDVLLHAEPFIGSPDESSITFFEKSHKK